MSEPRWLSAQQERAWRAYIGGSTRLAEQLDRDLRQQHAISMGEYEILVRLSDSDGNRLRMADLAHFVHHSPSRLTHTVARMEKAGLVVRTSCPEDRRGVFAEMTKAGNAKLVEAAPTHVAGVRTQLIDVVDPDDMVVIGRAFQAVLDEMG
ncbi:MAG: MarR family transcriptional regulator [Propionibacteriales bacterium]|nr:MarR family transcriptional regulator [Propionibacteriales bacterium]